MGFVALLNTTVGLKNVKIRDKINVWGIPLGRTKVQQFLEKSIITIVKRLFITILNN